MWDPLVRLFHWSLAGFFALAYWLENDWPALHSHAGYSVALLVVFRMAWGFIGSPHARFADFVVPPAATLDYLRLLLRGKPPDRDGHDPAGAVMIIVLLLSLLITTLSGMSLFAMEGSGPLAQTPVAGWPDGTMVDVHHFSADFSLLLVVIHVIGVLFVSLLKKRNLIWSMVTGRAGGRGRGDGRRFSSASLALLVVLIMAGSGEPAVAAQSAAVRTMLEELNAEAVAPFTAEAGRQTWYQDHEGRSCVTCHTQTLSGPGRHERTGKVIEPLAPSVNPQRLVDRKKIDKWFLRNCKWTYGRECTAQEKGDILAWLSEQ